MSPMTGGVFVKAKRAQSVADDESWKEGGVAPTLNAFDNAGESRATVVATLALSHSLTAAAAKGATEDGTGRGVPLATDAFLGVRRLTPRECERLMGWPDDHTRYTADGVEIADSARYRMCGNGVAAPVAKYVAQCVDGILNG